ncbi:hypothetical protein DM860_010420 [Cuscuta australis]|uniref:F-box/LRR-repeat protein 15/At3g58940/PEG3-like LRR domain-containing protein n=1 Tax=Cuscuta australis TaxID=267555 RepID=A0A328E149_9ASTE|nr:hypothetical protein DM860_010420 [Cuscuta australis]
MENIPVEVVGNRLLSLDSARDAVVASATCRKWREPWKNHLLSLAFSSNDWPKFRNLTSSELEVIITRTLFQTTGLCGLSLIMEDDKVLSPAPVIAWLMYTRPTLWELNYSVKTKPKINVLEFCGREKLEVLFLGHDVITGVGPTCLGRFLSLRELTLHCASISVLDLSLFLALAPILEFLNLICVDVVMSDPHATLELRNGSLRELYVEELLNLEKVVVEAENLETLHWKHCELDYFELVSKGGLRALTIGGLSTLHLDIGESAENLESVDLINFTFMRSKFLHTIMKSKRLKRLRLRGVVLDEYNNDIEALDLGTIASCFSRMGELSLSYELKEPSVNHELARSFAITPESIMELGWTIIIDSFSEWAGWVLMRGARLKKMVIRGVVSETKSHGECEKTLANFTPFIARLVRMRKSVYIEVRVEYE